MNKFPFRNVETLHDEVNMQYDKACNAQQDMETLHPRLVEARAQIAEMHFCLERNKIQEAENEACIRALELEQRLKAANNRQNIPPKRQPRSSAAIEKLIAQQVTIVTVAHETNRNSGVGINDGARANDTTGDVENKAHGCSYKEI
nr:hypothetical protein [Tanacetum cinerariifolium]